VDSALARCVPPRTDLRRFALVSADMESVKDVKAR
jgi:hypothetical protein